MGTFDIIDQPDLDLGGSPRCIHTVPSTISQFSSISSDTLTPTLPVEVFEHIIDQSDNLDGSLRPLSLTCRTFLPRARLNLFFRIHIGHKEKLYSAPAFFEAQPWLSPLVHFVTMRDYFMRDSFMLLAVIPSRLIAGVLPNIRGLELVRDWTGSGPLPPQSRFVLAYNSLQLSMIRSSCRSIRYLELTALKFRSAVEFVKLLCALSNLKSLVCQWIDFSESDDGTTGSLIKYKTLHLTHFVVSL